MFGKAAGLVGLVKDFVVENAEVEGKTQSDGVSGGKGLVGNGASTLVGLKRLLGGLVALVASSELGEVAVVITLPSGLSVLAIEVGAKQNAYILW